MKNKLFLFYSTPYFDIKYIKQLAELFRDSLSTKYKFIFDKELNSRIVNPVEFHNLYPNVNVINLLSNPYSRAAKFYVDNISNSNYSKNITRFVSELSHKDLTPLSSFIFPDSDYLRSDHLQEDLRRFSEKYDLNLKSFKYSSTSKVSVILSSELKENIRHLYRDDFDNFWPTN